MRIHLLMVEFHGQPPTFGHSTADRHLGDPSVPNRKVREVQPTRPRVNPWWTEPDFMARPRGQTSNSLLDTLSNWNTYLECNTPSEFL